MCYRGKTLITINKRRFEVEVENTPIILEKSIFIVRTVENFGSTKKIRITLIRVIPKEKVKSSFRAKFIELFKKFQYVRYLYRILSYVYDFVSDSNLVKILTSFIF